VSIALHRKRYTFEEFCDLIPDGEKADLIDGIIYMASPENFEHHDICGFLYRLVGDYLEETKIPGRLFGWRVAFRIGKLQGPEPDLGYLVPESLERIRPGNVIGPPDWAVEIVSPDSVERDYLRKRRLYERAGVLEYWVIDPLRRKLTCMRRLSSGKFNVVKLKADKLQSAVIPGFWVRPSWFWQSPLPAKKKVLTEILGEAKQ
jgi:Uma2 family endonuclease